MKSFDDQTYEVILERMLNRIPDDLDKREGSVIFDALAPAALEVAQVYHLMTITYRLIFGEASDGDMLELRAATFGVYRRLASFAVRLANFTDDNGFPTDIPMGRRFTVDGIAFRAIERVGLGAYYVESETPGTIGNKVQGAMLPTENLDGLGTATLSDVIVPGVEAQSDESLLEEFQIKRSSQATSGNEDHYKEWAKEVPGILDARVYENWNGPNTVKVVLTNTEKQSPSPYVIEQVYQHIESVRPVGAIVTVTGVGEKVISVTVKVTLREGTDPVIAKASITENIQEYFKSIAGVEDTVRYTSVGNAILDGVGIIDYSELLLNGSQANVSLSEDEVPLLGTFTMTT